MTALLQIVQKYLSEGFSLIPLIGGDDPSCGKRPVASWLAYQRQQPTINALQQWFEVAHYSAFGVVCGRVSQLVVLDIDDLAVVEAFQRRFPQLFETRIVRSGLRGGPHLYFRVDFPVKSQKVLGGDLKAEGSYVVGPGSKIAGMTWELVQDRAVRWLQRAELEAVLAFLSAAPHFSNAMSPRIADRPHHLPEPLARLIHVVTQRPALAIPESQPAAKVEEGGLLEPGEATPNPFAQVPATSQMLETVRGLYQRRVQQTQSRNQTLFELACHLRDAHYHQDWVIRALADLHAREPNRQPHKLHHETVARRRREALNTIASAFSRPPRPGKSIFVERDEPASRLPGTVRERLMQQSDGIPTLRVLEALSFVYLPAGTAFSEAEAGEWLHGRVGRYSLRRALEAHTEAGIAIFESVSPPSVRFCPPNKDAVGGLASEDFSASALAVGESRGDNSEKNRLEAHPHHRPAKHYRLPSHAELCQKLGVELLPGDPIYAEDVTSRKRYRTALQREFVRRRPGEHFQAMLAGRLSVSTRSIRRYHKAAGIHSRATYEDVWIGWSNLNSLPPKADLNELRLGGRVLMDETGKRYPAFRELAAKLLKQGRKLVHRTQRANVYWVGEVEPLLSQTQMMGKNYARQPASKFGVALPEIAALVVPAVENSFETPATHETELVYVKLLAPVQPKAPTQAERRPRQRREQRKYRYALDGPNEERWAQELYEQVPELSLSNARRMVDLYGGEVVEAVLGLLRWRMKQGWRLGELQKPVGYLLTVLRVKWRSLYGFHVPYPRFAGQKRRRKRPHQLELPLDNPDLS